MKQNKIKIYAKALAAAIGQKLTPAQEKKVTDNFLKLLEKTGDIGKAREILDMAESLLLVKQGKRKITFQTARKMTEVQRKALKDFAKAGDIANEKINPELIAGIKIIINDSQQFDASLQSKLANMF